MSKTDKKSNDNAPKNQLAISPDITFEKVDLFSRKEFADRLTTVITNFYPFYEEAFVLSLNAKYGSGKTTFLKMWANQLNTDGYEVIYINAWESDFDEEPLIAIIYSLLSQVPENQSAKRIKSATQGILGAAALGVTQYLENASGINIEELIKRAQSEASAGDLKKIGSALYEGYEYKKNSYAELNQSLKKYVESLGKKPLFIFVDELDRVRPNYAVKFLEAIKHIFSQQGICFVIGVDRQQLEKSVKQLYGDIDFKNYYARFITREAELPETEINDIKSFIGRLAEKFFDEKRSAGINFPFEKKSQSSLIDIIGTTCHAHHFTPRNIETFFRIFSQFMAVYKTDKKYARENWIAASCLLIALSIHSPELYKDMGLAIDPTKNTELWLSKIKLDQKGYIIQIVYAFCLRSNDSEKESIARLYSKRSGTLESDNDQSLNDLIFFINGSPIPRLNRESGFQFIYKKLEEWRAFID